MGHRLRFSLHKQTIRREVKKMQFAIGCAIILLIIAVLAIGFSVSCCEELERKDEEIADLSDTVTKQSSKIKDLHDDEANLLVQIQSAHHREESLIRRAVDAENLMGDAENELKEVKKQLKNLKSTSSRKQKQYLRVIRNLQRWIIRHDFKHQADFREMGITKAVDVALKELEDE